MSAEGKVRVVVKSRRVPSGITEFSVPEFASSGVLMGTRRSRAVLYDYVLDGDQKKAIDEGHRLSRSLGLELEVVDRSRMGVLGRMMAAFLGNGSGGPTLIIAPSPTDRTGGTVKGIAPTQV